MIKSIKDMDISIYYIIEVNENHDNGIKYVKNFIHHKDEASKFELVSDRSQALHMSHDDAIIVCECINSKSFFDSAMPKRYVSINIEDNRSSTGILDEMSTHDRIDISSIVDEPKLIYGWDDLSKVPPSHTHAIDISDPNYCSGHIRNKIKSNTFNYLSTHTFYGCVTKEYAASTKRLQECGFNIMLDNWDKGVDNLEEPLVENSSSDKMCLSINNVICK